MPQENRITPQENGTCGKQGQRRRNQSNGFCNSDEPRNWMSRLLRRRRQGGRNQQGPIEGENDNNQMQRGCGRRQRRRTKSNLF